MNLPTYNEDPAVLYVGTMENHAYFIPFSDEESARSHDRTRSARIPCSAALGASPTIRTRGTCPMHSKKPTLTPPAGMLSRCRAAGKCSDMTGISIPTSAIRSRSTRRTSLRTTPEARM